MSFRVLISVAKKDGVVDLARELDELGGQIISSGGTADAIRDKGIPVTSSLEYTGVPAMLGHRVVTLTPKIHGGILADRDDPQHQADMLEHGIETIDIVIVNAYDFAGNPSIETIDIGGPTMIRGAAKNNKYVIVLVDPADYREVLDAIRTWRDGGEKGDMVSADLRHRLAVKAFEFTMAYDSQILDWLRKGYMVGDIRVLPAFQWPDLLHPVMRKTNIDLRYGENPHQIAALYTTGRSWIDTHILHQGQDKKMGYLNFFDADAAWRAVWLLGGLYDDEPNVPTAVVFKHANPCGVAQRNDIAKAYVLARECDSDSAFGGVVAVNRPITVEMAREVVTTFIEVLIAPGYEAGALEILSAKENLRVIEAVPPRAAKFHTRFLDGGEAALVQTADELTTDHTEWEVVSGRVPTYLEWRDVKLALGVALITSSNAIALAKGGVAWVGCGQPNRRDSGKLAALKADGRAAGGALASEAFFPYPDGLDGAVEAGSAIVVQPGGSKADDDVIARAKDLGLTMVLTHERHFKH